MLAELDKRGTPKAKRDKAAIRLLYDLGLRRGEVVGLDVGDVDLEVGTLAVLGKGRSEKTRLTLPPETQAALREWLSVRGDPPGPLFPNFDRARKGRRLTGAGLYALVRKLGQSVGVDVWPHGLRHTAITEALDLTEGDVRAVQRFSRHRDVRVLTIYDDNRTDMAGKVARMVASNGNGGPAGGLDSE